jgi:hypothetical protein
MIYNLLVELVPLNHYLVLRLLGPWNGSSNPSHVSLELCIQVDRKR